MRLNKLVLIIVVIIILLIIMHANFKKNEPVVENIQPQQMEENISPEKKQPNALDVLAPEYDKMQKQVQDLKNIRQQSIEEQEKILNKNE